MGFFPDGQNVDSVYCKTTAGLHRMPLGYGGCQIPERESNGDDGKNIVMVTLPFPDSGRSDNCRQRHVPFLCR